MRKITKLTFLSLLEGYSLSLMVILFLILMNGYCLAVEPNLIILYIEIFMVLISVIGGIILIIRVIINKS